MEQESSIKKNFTLKIPHTASETAYFFKAGIFLGKHFELKILKKACRTVEWVQIQFATLFNITFACETSNYLKGSEEIK